MVARPHHVLNSRIAAEIYSKKLELMTPYSFESSLHTEQRVRVAICNIILQRVQGFIPISKPVQRELNEWLMRRVEVTAE